MNGICEQLPLTMDSVEKPRVPVALFAPAAAAGEAKLSCAPHVANTVPGAG
jgi:hypothetical protein